MTSHENHKKHADLQRPKLGKFGRNELAILGTDCNAVQLLAQRLQHSFPKHRIGFADADHEESDDNVGLHYQQKSNGAGLFLPDFNNEYLRKIGLAGADAVIVNGNHFAADAQIVVCNPAKEKSLRKRNEELTSVRAILLPAGILLVPDYVKELVPNFLELPLFREEEFEVFANWYEKNLLVSPPLRALILTGGKSIRMGKDKSKINYHGKEQFLHLYKMLETIGVEPHISCRKEQSLYYEESGCRSIIDKILDLGPLGGIMSAFMSFPDHAWLVLATDVPLLDLVAIEELLAARQSGKVATAYRSPFDKFPEPLIAIWEPKSFPLMLQFMALGYSCPRKVLINSDSYIVESSTPWKLENVNTIEDLEDLKTTMKEQALRSTRADSN